MRSSHNSSITSMATATTKKTRRLLKKEVMFTSRCLQKLDLDVMEAFVVKEMDAVRSALSREVSAVSVYMLRQGLRQKTFV